MEETPHMNTPVVQHAVEFNQKLLSTVASTSLRIARIAGDGVGKAYSVARDTGATVVGQTRSATQRTVDEVTSNTKQVVGQARSATQRTVDEVSSNTKEVVGQARSATQRTVDEVSSNTKEVVGQARAQGKRGAEQIDDVADSTARRAIDAVDDSPSSGTPYEQWSKSELYERAQELDIDGRSSMSKRELIDALRSA
jgi:gas vesicle protein